MNAFSKNCSFFEFAFSVYDKYIRKHFAYQTKNQKLNAVWPDPMLSNVTAMHNVVKQWDFSS